MWTVAKYQIDASNNWRKNHPLAIHHTHRSCKLILFAFKSATCLPQFCQACKQQNNRKKNLKTNSYLFTHSAYITSLSCIVLYTITMQTTFYLGSHTTRTNWLALPHIEMRHVGKVFSRLNGARVFFVLFSFAGVVFHIFHDFSVSQSGWENIRDIHITY